MKRIARNWWLAYIPEDFWFGVMHINDAIHYGCGPLEFIYCPKCGDKEPW